MSNALLKSSLIGCLLFLNFKNNEGSAVIGQQNADIQYEARSNFGHQNNAANLHQSIIEVFHLFMV